LDQAAELDAAREYLRVSKDRSGRERSNEDQQGENREEWAGRLRFADLPPYRDAISASRYAGKPRDDWPKLVADIAADRFGARVLVLWESSRGSRRNSEWAAFLELCRDHDIDIAVTDEERIYRLHNAKDLRDLQMAGPANEYESAKTSGRLRRTMAANGRNGAMHGRTPWGYRRIYDERTGRLLRQEPSEEPVIGPPPVVATLMSVFGWPEPYECPSEAASVRELFDRLVKGHALNRIAIDFAARGITTKRGKPWTPNNLRDTARLRLYIGERVYAPDASSEDRKTGRGDVTYTKAQWPGIIDPVTFWQVQRILADPARSTAKNHAGQPGWRPGRAIHPLSSIALCHPCGGPLTVTFRYERRTYQCHKGGHVTGIGADELEAIAEAAIVGYLARPENFDTYLNGDDANDQALEAVRGEIAALRHALDELEDRLKRREISAGMAGAAEAQYEADLAAAVAQERDLSTPSRLRGLIEPGAGVAKRWKDTPLEARREIARILLAPDHLGELRVDRGRGKSVEERVVWRTAGAGQPAPSPS
jgi:DNA invertase Pin-like site-specific DNA recombinase